MTDDAVLQLVQDTFKMPRPANFTDHGCCSECAEHDQTLQAHTLDSLGYAEVGSAAWNPITMCQPDAFAYWMPALGRIVLEPEDPYWGWYGEQFFRNELCWDGPRNARWAYCTPAQRRTVAALIEHVVDPRSELIAKYDMEYEMLRALEVWWDAGD